MTPEIPFKRNVVAPVECLKAGWEIAKDQYWLIVGMCAVGMLIGSAVPMGILLAPMMCGLYLTFFKRMRREPIEFGTLFKGFDYFGQAVVATLLHVVPLLIIIVPAYFLFYIVMIAAFSLQAAVDDSAPVAVFLVFAMFGLFWLVIMLLVIVVSIGFTFAHPLIVDRKMQGFDAVKLSFRAAMANFWRLLGMSVLSGLLSAVGFLACYVGMFLVLPITYGAVAAAYDQVFGLSNPKDLEPDLPPPPPSFN